MSLEFTVNGQTYRTGRMDAFRQFHVVRRIAPVISALADVGDLKTAFSASASRAASPEDLGAVLGPLAKAAAAMPDADVDYILGTCLDVVERKQPGGGWARVRTSGGALMFDDIDMSAMLMIAAGVLRHNLSGFFFGLPSVSPAGGRTSGPNG